MWFASWRPTIRIKRLRQSCCLLLAIAPCAVHAQNVWTYEIVLPDNRTVVTQKPPKDISYPPAGQLAVVSRPDETIAVPISAAEAAARLRAPKLIILLAPEYTATQP